ncbi:MAG: hypothetical protein ACI9OO_002022, partial [Bacteroidia bacterium]
PDDCVIAVKGRDLRADPQGFIVLRHKPFACVTVTE